MRHNIIRYSIFLFCIFWLLIQPVANMAQSSRIVYGLTNSVVGIDPHLHSSPEVGIVLRQIYDTLVYRDPQTREIVPGLASSWTISDDQLVYTFSLRDDVTFHDGTKFNAEAVGANFSRIFNSEIDAQRSRDMLGSIASYQVVDEYTFRIRLSQPFTPLLDSLSQVNLAIASPAAINAYQDAPLRYQFHQVGTGPFRMVEYVPENRIVIERNLDYAWKPAIYNDLPANPIHVVEFRFFLNPEERLTALENGEAHIMGDLPPIAMRTIVGSSEITLLPTVIPGQPLQFYFNTAREPVDDIRVRQALAYAANRTSIIEAVFQGFSPLAWGPLSAATLYYNRGVQGVYAYDVPQAEALLANAGFVDTNNDGILERDDVPLEINVLQPREGLLPQVTELLLDQWGSIGVRVNIEPVPGPRTLQQRLQDEDTEYHLVARDQSGLDPYMLNAAYLSNSPQNLTGYANPELDSILLQAAAIPDGNDRRILYGQAQAIILQDALILPLRDYTNLNAYRSTIVGLRYDAYGWYPMLHDVGLR